MNNRKKTNKKSKSAVVVLSDNPEVTGSKQGKEVVQAKSKFDDYYSAYFKALRDEIGISLQSHTKFVVQKIVTIMATYVILLNGQLVKVENNLITTESYCKLMLPLILISIAYVYDILIAKNICNIHKIGYFIKYRIEKRCGKMWEYYLKQESNERVSFNYLDFFGIITFDLLLILISIFLTLSSIYQYAKVDYNTLFSPTNTPYILFISLYVICIYMGIKVYIKIYKLINMVFDNNGKEI